MATPRTLTRIRRVLFGPRPFEGTAGTLRGAAVLFVTFFVLTVAFDLLFSSLTSTHRDGIVSHLVAAAFFAAVMTIFQKTRWLRWPRS